MQRKSLAQLVRIEQVRDVSRGLNMSVDVQRVEACFKDLKNSLARR
jgi:hypothetical protein